MPKENPDVSRISTCILCRKSNLKAVLELAPTPVADAYIPESNLEEKQETFPLALALCLDCSNVQLLDIVNPDILYGKYKYMTSKSPGLIEHFEAYAQHLLNSVNPLKGGLVVDIGSNDGTLLSFFKKNGMRVLGIDPASDLAQRATIAGIETLPAYFTSELADKIRKKNGHAAVITANNVIANIADLADFINGVKILLDNDGVFIFETGYLSDMITNMVFDNIYHEHLCYYSVRPLESFFHANGMEMIEVRRVNTKGGSLRGIVQLRNGRRKASPSLSSFLEMEEQMGISSPEAFKEFSDRMEKVKSEATSLIGDIKSQGRTLAGYCASQSVTTLLYYLGIGDSIDFIVDDSPLKQGLFSPGYHIPVLHPDKIYEKMPDYVVILAWRFSRQIIEQHQEYINRGGHFINVWPKLEII